MDPGSLGPQQPSKWTGRKPERQFSLKPSLPFFRWLVKPVCFFQTFWISDLLQVWTLVSQQPPGSCQTLTLHVLEVGLAVTGAMRMRERGSIFIPLLRLLLVTSSSLQLLFSSCPSGLIYFSCKLFRVQTVFILCLSSAYQNGVLTLAEPFRRACNITHPFGLDDD